MLVACLATNVPKTRERKTPVHTYLDAPDVNHGAARELVVFVAHEGPDCVEMTSTRLAHGTRYRHLVVENRMCS